MSQLSSPSMSPLLGSHLFLLCSHSRRLSSSCFLSPSPLQPSAPPFSSWHSRISLFNPFPIYHTHRAPRLLVPFFGAPLSSLVFSVKPFILLPCQSVSDPHYLDALYLPVHVHPGLLATPPWPLSNPCHSSLSLRQRATSEASPPEPPSQPCRVFVHPSVLYLPALLRSPRTCHASATPFSLCPWATFLPHQSYQLHAVPS